MKKFLVVLLACALIFGFAATASAADTQIKEFSDIADQSQAAQNAIMKLAVLGVVEGNEGIGGSFRPADNLTRAEFAKIVCYLTGNVKLAESLANVGTKFTDVSTGNWYTGWVNAAAQSGYFVGDPGGTFRPNANITMQEVVAVALRAAGYNDKLGSSTGNTAWPSNYINKAMNVGLLDDVTFVGSSAATRTDMAIICNEVLGINMVVHINNDIAYAMALSDGTVDPDGFSEIYYISNETNREKIYETILHKAFDGVYHDVQIDPARVRTIAVGNNSIEFDETAGWYYEDFSSKELALHVGREFYPNDKTFKDWGYENSNDEWVGYNYSQGEALAETYYITGEHDLTDLAAMQAQITVIDGDEICFVEVISSKVDAESIYWEGSNIMVDGKSYRPSDQMDVGNRITPVWYDSVVDGTQRSGIEDYTRNVYFLANSGDDDDTIQRFATAETDDNDFGGRVYLDAKGRIYGVKNYDAYDGVVFGIFEKIDENVVEYKDDNSKNKDNHGGADKFNKTETDKNYTLYLNGEQAKFEDLDENDLVYYLGDNGAPFFWASCPKEGELTKQTNTAVTVGGKAWNVDENPYADGMLFHLSDDGGETFGTFDIALPPYQIESFGEAEYANAYNFNKLAYVNSNLTNTKIIGVITKIDPTQNWSDGVRKERYQEITIYNAEGKEVTYKFTNDFRDGYTYWARLGLDNSAWLIASGGASKWTSAISNPWKGVENIASGVGLKEGDIVQLTLDKNDNVKKISNYASFEIGSAEGKVLASKERLNVTGTGTSGSFTINKDAVVYEVATDADSEYDDTSIVSVASVLASDFNASKIVAFDIKSNSNVMALYIIRSISVAKYGILTQVAVDNDGWILTINGQEMRADEPAEYWKSRKREVIAYNVVGGEVVPVRTVAKDNAVYEPLKSAADGTNADIFGLSGPVGANGTNSSNRSVTIDGTIVYVTSDTYMYNLAEKKNEVVTSLSDLRGKYVVAYRDKDYDAICIAIISNDPAFVPTAEVKSSDTDVATVNGSNVTWPTGDGTLATPYEDAINVANGVTGFTADMIPLPTGASIAFYTTNGYSATQTMPIDLNNPVGAAVDVFFVITAADGTTQTYYHLEVTQLAINATVTVKSILGDNTLTYGGEAGTYDTPRAITDITSVPFSTTAITAANIVPTVTGAAVQLYTDDRFVFTATSVNLAANDTTTVYFTVTSSDGSATMHYTAAVPRAAGQTGDNITNATTVMGVNITAGIDGTHWTVALPVGTDLSTLTVADVVPGGVSTGATVGTKTITGSGTTRTVTIPVTAEVGGAPANHEITVTVSAAPAAGRGTFDAESLADYVDGNLASEIDRPGAVKLSVSLAGQTVTMTVSGTNITAADGTKTITYNGTPATQIGTLYPAEEIADLASYVVFDLEDILEAAGYDYAGETVYWTGTRTGGVKFDNGTWSKNGSSVFPGDTTMVILVYEGQDTTLRVYSDSTRKNLLLTIVINGSSLTTATP